MRVVRILRSWIVPTLTVGLTLSILGCEETANVEPEEAAVLSGRLEAFETTLTEDLGLSVTNASSVRSLISDLGAETPGALWHVASQLRAKMSDEEFQTFVERAAALPSRSDRNLRAEGSRRRGGQRGMGDGWRGFGPGSMTGPLAGLLTDEQKEQVRVLREEHRKQLEELRRQVESENLTRADARGRMQALRESMRASFGNLLTPEQRSALETRHEQREAERAGRHELGRRTAAEVLELTDAEAAEFEAIVETAREAMMEVRKDARVEGLSIDDSRQRLDDIRETRNTALADLMDRNRVEIVIIHDVLVHQFAPRQFHRRLSGQPLKGSGQDSWSGRHRRQRSQG